MTSPTRRVLVAIVCCTERAMIRPDLVFISEAGKYLHALDVDSTKVGCQLLVSQ